MEVALVSAALVGVGLAWRTNAESDQTPSHDDPQASVVRPRQPDAANVREGANAFASSDHRIPATGIEGARRGSLSGRRDHSLFIDAPSQYQRSMERIYRPPVGSKKEVQASMKTMEEMRSNNVQVRSNIGYREEFFNTLEKPVRMHNVNPVATTSGTASQLVGPGLSANKHDEWKGQDGLHYGMVRMRPAVVENTFREMKGVPVPGKANVDKRTAEVNLMQHAASGYTIGATGFEKAEEGAERMKFHAISEDYMKSAKGRAIVTGNPGAGGHRLEPTKSFTNRGMESISVQDATGRAAAGLEAADDRSFATTNVQENRGRANGGVPLGPASGALAPGHFLVQYQLPAEQRGTTEEERGKQILNLSNPGQSNGALLNNQPAQTTQRQSMDAFNVGIGKGSGVAWGGGLESTRGGEGTTKTSRLPNEYRPGAAGNAITVAGGQQNQHEAYAHGGLADATQRDRSSEFSGPMKAVGVNAPMSYSDILASEGYSNRDVPQLGFVPPAQQSTHNYSIGAFDARPALPNASREGGVENQANLNFYVRNNANNQNPNRIETGNRRLDPNILDALSKNELSLVH